jgi:plasmid stabilization system protein ParE
MANDIIGFNIEADNPEKLKEYDARLKATYATLTKSPNMLHKGQIR